MPQRAILYRAAALLWTGNEARRVDHRRAHPKVPLAPARGVFSSQDENVGKEQYTPEGY